MFRFYVFRSHALTRFPRLLSIGLAFALCAGIVRGAHAEC